MVYRYRDTTSCGGRHQQGREQRAVQAPVHENLSLSRAYSIEIRYVWKDMIFINFCGNFTHSCKRVLHGEEYNDGIQNWPADVAAEADRNRVCT